MPILFVNNRIIHMISLVLIGFSIFNCENQQESEIPQKPSALVHFLPDTSYINNLNFKANELRRSDPDSAFYYARIACKLSEQSGYQEGIANAYLMLGNIHLINYTPNDSATFYLKKADTLYKLDKNDFGMGMVAFSMTYVYSFQGDLHSSEQYMRTSLTFFEKINHKRGLYNTYNALAYIFQHRKEYDPAYTNMNKAINLAYEIQDTLLMAESNNNLGNIYKDQFLFNHAIDVYYKALNLWESKQDSAGMSIAYGNIGLMYHYLEDYNKALEFYKKKLPVSIQSNDSWEESRTYNDIGFAYLSLHKPDTALVYYRKGLELNKMMNYPPGIAKSFHHLATTFFQMSEYDSAYSYVSKSIKEGEEMNVVSDLASDYILLGKIQLVNKKTSEAMDNLIKGYDLADEYEIPGVQADASKILNQEYQRNDQYKLAYQYLNQYKQIQDSIRYDENISKITRLEIQYEFDKKQREIEMAREKDRLAHLAALKQQRIYLFMTFVFVLFLIITGIMVVRQKNLSLRIKTVDLEQKLLRVQMNPHFIFNSLCAVQDYILNNKNIEASAFLIKLARLIRSILEISKKDYVTLEKEKEILEYYLEIQKKRFEAGFIYRFEIDDQLDPEIVAIPPMLSQPFIENAIEHGLVPLKDKGRIVIRYSFENGLIRFEVEDNGIGRKQAAHNQTQNFIKKQSLATALAVERIQHIQRSENKKTSFEIVDLENAGHACGTKVIFKIPYRHILTDSEKEN